MALLSGVYTEADYHRRAIEEMMRQQQQAYGQQMQGIAGQYIDNSPPKSNPERDNPVLLLLLP